MSFFESAKTRQIVALTGVLLLFVFLFYSLSNFIPSFLGALVLYIIFYPVMNYLHGKKKLNKTFVAILIIIVSILIIIIPSFLLGNLLIGKLEELLSGNTLLITQLKNGNAYIKDYTGFNIVSPENIANMQNKAATLLPNLLSHTFTILLYICIMFFILFFMLYSWRSVTEMIVYYFPYKKENSELFAKELIAQTYSNVIGAPLLAVVQGVISIIGFYVFGLKEPVFWGAMCAFLSFVPYIGSALVWVPAGIIQLSMAEQWQGIGILIYGIVAISSINHIFRFIFQNKVAHVHPLVTVFGIVVGVDWFGLPGLIFGPILISYFFIMVKIYRIEYGNTNFLKD
jgi:predicted PurR-regulated permease PerM